MNRVLFVLASVALACSGSESLEPAEQPAAAALIAPSRAAGETLTVLRDGRAIHVRVASAPPNADPDRVVLLRVDGFPDLDGLEALDAVFVGHGVAVVGTDHRLRWYGQPSAAAVELDQDVEPPLSSAGERLAYARGEMPFYAIVTLELSTRVPKERTEAGRSCWSPAVADDGSLAYVCTHEGRPTLFVNDGVERALPTERFPASPLAPHFDGARLAFTDEAGAVVVDARTGALVAVDDEAGAVFQVSGGLVATGVDGSLRTLDVAEVSR